MGYSDTQSHLKGTIMFKNLKTAYSNNTNKIRQKTLAVVVLAGAAVGLGLYLNSKNASVDLLEVTETAADALKN